MSISLTRPRLFFPFEAVLDEAPLPVPVPVPPPERASDPAASLAPPLLIRALSLLVSRMSSGDWNAFAADDDSVDAAADVAVAAVVLDAGVVSSNAANVVVFGDKVKAELVLVGAAIVLGVVAVATTATTVVVADVE